MSSTSNLIKQTSSKESKMFNPWKNYDLTSLTNSILSSQCSIKHTKQIIKPLNIEQNIGKPAELNIERTNCFTPRTDEQTVKEFTCETERFSTFHQAGRNYLSTISKGNKENFGDEDIESVEENLDYEGNTSPSIDMKECNQIDCRKNSNKQICHDIYRMFIKDSHRKNLSIENIQSFEDVKQNTKTETEKKLRIIKQIDDKVKSIVNARPFSPPFSPNHQKIGQKGNIFF